MDIVIYGVGSKSKVVANKLKKIHNIIGYTDNKSNIKEFNNNKFYKVEELESIVYDYIILAIDNGKASTIVRKYLTVKFKIDSWKIIDFYNLYNKGVPNQKVDKVMQNPNNLEGYGGIILGLSHSEVGINPQYLSGNFCNLSVSSQDIYYNLKTLEYCKDNYLNEIKNLRYVILDMFDYNYFNFDVSLTTDIINYFSWGGYNLDYNNYHKNKSFTLTVEEELAKLNCKIINSLNKEEINLRDELFDNLYSNSEVEMFRDFPTEEQRSKVIEEGANDYYMPYNMPKCGRNRYEETIEKNKIYFEKILKLLYELNPKIRIYLVLIPRYKTVEESHKTKYCHWKVEFEEYINSLNKRYKFKYLDFKGCEEISCNNKYYQDVAHLNYEGAKKFTTMLSSFIDY